MDHIFPSGEFTRIIMEQHGGTEEEARARIADLASRGLALVSRNGNAVALSMLAQERARKMREAGDPAAQSG